MIQQFYFWVSIPKSGKAGSQRGISTPMFTAASLTMPKMQKRPSVQWWIDEQNVVHPHNGMLFSVKKERNSDICYNRDMMLRHKKTNADLYLYEVLRAVKIIKTIFFFFGLFRAAPAAYGGYQARGWIRTTAANLLHSHSNARSEPCLWPTPQLSATPGP